MLWYYGVILMPVIVGIVLVLILVASVLILILVLEDTVLKTSLTIAVNFTAAPLWFLTLLQ